MRKVYFSSVGGPILSSSFVLSDLIKLTAVWFTPGKFSTSPYRICSSAISEVNFAELTDLQ